MSVLEFKVENQIACLTLNRPEAHNALNPELTCRLADAWTSVRDDDAIRVAVITGKGASFCSGGDLGALIPLISGAKQPADMWDQRFLEDRKIIYRALLRDFDTEKPVIAAINGHAIAGGMEILLGTDIRVAAPGVKLGVQEVKWAVFPGGGSTVRMPRQLPYAKAMEMLLTGDVIRSEEALQLGFLNHVTAPQEEMTKALEIAAKITNNGPLAVKAIRASARACLGLPERDGLALESKYSARVFASEDAKEGPRAFKEKRKPVYRGV